jgi:hypothetical protein
VNEHTSRRRCPSCGTGGSYPTDMKSCPLCGGSLKSEPTVAGDGLVVLLKPFAAALCPACGMTTFLRRNRRCIRCSAAVSEEARSHVDEAVRQRRRASKGRIQRLKRQAQNSVILQSSFPRKGQGVSLTDSINTVFESFRNAVTALANGMRTELRVITWDPKTTPSSPGILFSYSCVYPLLFKRPEQVPPFEALLRMLSYRSGQSFILPYLQSS